MQVFDDRSLCRRSFWIEWRIENRCRCSSCYVSSWTESHTLILNVCFPQFVFCGNFVTWVISVIFEMRKIVCNSLNDAETEKYSVFCQNAYFREKNRWCAPTWLSRSYQFLLALIFRHLRLRNVLIIARLSKIITTFYFYPFAVTVGSAFGHFCSCQTVV